MIEIAQNQRTADAYKKAHEERGEFIARLVRRVFRKH